MEGMFAEVFFALEVSPKLEKAIKIMEHFFAGNFEFHLHIETTARQKLGITTK